MSYKILEDRISLLPDIVLVHILDFLYTVDAVKTSLLSKRWVHLWTHTFNLIYRQPPSFLSTQKYIEFINQTTISHRSSCKIKIFFLDFAFFYNKDLDSHINTWIRAATVKKMEKLHLNFAFGGGHLYALPQHLYNNIDLVYIGTTCCDFVPSGCVRWTSLKVLKISNAKLNDDVLDKILSGSPLLEYLNLIDCHGVTRIQTSSKTLKELVIGGGFGNGDLPPLKIWCPNLLSLEISGRRKFHLMNVPSSTQILATYAESWLCQKAH